jgi:hypothetical protein
MLRANVEPAGMGWEPGRAAVAAGSYGFNMAVIIWLVVSNITWLMMVNIWLIYMIIIWLELFNFWLVVSKVQTFF